MSETREMTLREYVESKLPSFHLAVKELNKLESDVKVLEAERDNLQATIDELMLEYCPDDMTDEQLENWGNHQESVEEQDSE
jgi:hypothetical protein